MGGGGCYARRTDQKFRSFLDLSSCQITNKNRLNLGHYEIQEHIPGPASRRLVYSVRSESFMPARLTSSAQSTGIGKNNHDRNHGAINSFFFFFFFFFFRPPPLLLLLLIFCPTFSHNRCDLLTALPKRFNQFVT